MRHPSAGSTVSASTWTSRYRGIYISDSTATHSANYFCEPPTFILERWLDAEYTDEEEASQALALSEKACIGRASTHLPINCSGLSLRPCSEADRGPFATLTALDSFAYVQIASLLLTALHNYNMKLVNKDLDFERVLHCRVVR